MTVWISFNSVLSLSRRVGGVIWIVDDSRLSPTEIWSLKTSEVIPPMPTRRQKKTVLSRRVRRRGHNNHVAVTVKLNWLSMAQRDISNVGVLLTHCDRFSIYCATHVAVMSVRFPPACHSVCLSLNAESRRVVRPIDASCMSLASISFRLIRVQIARCRLNTRRTAGHHRPNGV